ncbi:MAG: hypothetical protein ACI9K2_003457 [Myxococcota bacterium]|jgi:uncharacterized protein (DUF2252 family)
MVVLFALACSQADPAPGRQAWLVDALVDDNRIWLSRDGELLAAKYRKMAADPYDYMRGTQGVFLADLARAGTERVGTSFVTVPEAGAVLLVGDPHPENIGLFLPGEGPGPGLGEPSPVVFVLEPNDLDGAAFGPWVLDLRRAALGLAVLADALDGCGVGCRHAAIEALAEGYTDGIGERADGERAVRAAELDGWGAIVADQVERVLVEGRRRDRLVSATVAPDLRTRSLAVDRALHRDQGVLALTGKERAQLDRLLADSPLPRGFRELGAARVFGLGVASLPAVRFMVLWDRGDDGPADDELLQLREVVDPAAVPTLGPSVPGLFDDNADRLSTASRLLWERSDTDVRSAGVTDGDQAFKHVTWSSWNQGFDHSRIAADWAAGRADEDDLAGLAERIGHVLAGAHARAPTASGGRGLAAISRDIDGRSRRFASELVTATDADIASLSWDYRLFRGALSRLGPLLGAGRLAEDVHP